MAKSNLQKEYEEGIFIWNYSSRGIRFQYGEETWQQILGSAAGIKSQELNLNLEHETEQNKLDVL